MARDEYAASPPEMSAQREMSATVLVKETISDDRLTL